MVILKRFLLIPLFGILILSCVNELDPPTPNPLDPSNPETNGDPFNLKVEIQDQKAFLTWDQVNVVFDSYVLYRSSTQLAIVPKSTTNYTDSTCQSLCKYQISVRQAERESQLSSPVYFIPKDQEVKWGKDGALMFLIPVGSFEMGDSKDKTDSRMKYSRPVHAVELDAFYMDIYEVTVGKFKEFVRETGYEYDRWDDVAEYSPTDEHPMVLVSWMNVTAYAQWASKRLPTEAEWEYAARGGLDGKRYPWGDDESVTRDHANYSGTGGKDQWESCAPVGSFAANGYGLYDMAGNVYEWCSDWYGKRYYSSSPSHNPQGPSSGRSRVLRGGSWNITPNLLRADYRFNLNPSNTNFNCGFRCVSGL